ncbi:hypothetical protein N7451_002643 [Penicillium sp. IBT 35674x]|nr:hypothetical protein N7451_002643 [Penicillium sp. IBT 35674x]
MNMIDKGVMCMVDLCESQKCTSCHTPTSGGVNTTPCCLASANLTDFIGHASRFCGLFFLVEAR